MPGNNRSRHTLPESEPNPLERELAALRALLRQALDRAARVGDEEEERELARLMRVIDSLSKSAARLDRMQAARSGARADTDLSAEIRRALKVLREQNDSLAQEGGRHGSQ